MKYELDNEAIRSSVLMKRMNLINSLSEVLERRTKELLEFGVAQMAEFHSSEVYKNARQEAKQRSMSRIRSKEI